MPITNQAAGLKWNIHTITLIDYIHQIKSISIAAPHQFSSRKYESSIYLELEIFIMGEVNVPRLPGVGGRNADYEHICEVLFKCNCIRKLC